jgi:hypothetical protein
MRASSRERDAQLSTLIASPRPETTGSFPGVPAHTTTSTLACRLRGDSRLERCGNTGTHVVRDRDGWRAAVAGEDPQVSALPQRMHSTKSFLFVLGPYLVDSRAIGP